MGDRNKKVMSTPVMKKILLNNPRTLKIIQPDMTNEKTETSRNKFRYGSSNSTMPAEPTPKRARKNGSEQHGLERNPKITALIPVRVPLVGEQLFLSAIIILHFIQILIKG